MKGIIYLRTDWNSTYMSVKVLMFRELRMLDRNLAHDYPILNDLAVNWNNADAWNQKFQGRMRVRGAVQIG